MYVIVLMEHIVLMEQLHRQEHLYMYLKEKLLVINILPIELYRPRVFHLLEDAEIVE